MASGTDGEANWSPDPRFPDIPEFYRRVLEFSPTPTVVVDELGNLIYANGACLALGRWDPDFGAGSNLLDYVHADDRAWVAQSFSDIAIDPESHILGAGTEWAEIYLRLRANDGSTVPVELVGAGGILDPVVRGVIYAFRPAHSQDLFGRVLDGLGQGASMHQLLTLVVELIAALPLQLDAAVFQLDANDHTTGAVVTSRPELSHAIVDHLHEFPWHEVSPEPAVIDRAKVPDGLLARLRDLGVRDILGVSAESPLTPVRLCVIAFGPANNVASAGRLHRLLRARQLASAVLLRSQADRFLDFAAQQDPLTELPNRASFAQQANQLDQTRDRAAIHLDLDGLERVNSTNGRAFGDAAIRVIADRIRSVCAIDDVIGRTGDDEFSVALRPRRQEDNFEEHALLLAGRILASIGDPLFVAGRLIEVTASIGVALAGPDEPMDQLLTRADAAMRQAKLAGGGQIHRDRPGW